MLSWIGTRALRFALGCRIIAVRNGLWQHLLVTRSTLRSSREAQPIRACWAAKERLSAASWVSGIAFHRALSSRATHFKALSKRWDSLPRSRHLVPYSLVPKTRLPLANKFVRAFFLGGFPREYSSRSWKRSKPCG